MGALFQTLRSDLRYFQSMKLLLRHATILPVLCLAFAGHAQTKPAKPEPDILIFTNGDQLKGTLERGVGGNIVFKSDMAGEITVSLDKVKQLKVAGHFAVLKKDVPPTRQPVTPGAIAVASGKLTVSTPAGAQETLPVASVGYIVDQKTYAQDIAATPKFYQGWNGSVTAGANIQRSTSNGSTYTAGVALVRTVPVVSFIPARNRTTVDFTDTYGKITQPVIPPVAGQAPATIAETSIFHAGAERDQYLAPRFYALAETAFDHNFSQGLDLQQIYGAGFGWTPIKTGPQQLDLKFDLHYEKQQFNQQTSPGTPNLNLIGSTFAEAYHRALPRKLVLTETANILPAWNDFNAYSANASVILAAPVFHRLSLTVTSTDNFLNNPAEYYKKNSFQFVTGITYTLR
jgi:hypothetical protein